MAEDPYKLLGISKGASDDEVRKAYRALAKKLHPDVNPDPAAADRFKKISAAYSLLSDKDMRARYDSGQVDGQGQQQSPFHNAGFGQRGPNGQAGGFQGGGFDDMGDIFSSLFGMQGGGNRGGARLRPQKGGDIRFSLKIDFVEAVKGAVKSVQMGNGRKLKITIPPGTEDGSVLRLRGKGDAGAHGGPRGDAKVDITVRSHKYFKRDGDILRLDLPITLAEAISGAKITVPTPGGDVKISVPNGSSSGKTLRLKGKGIKGGDMLVRLMVTLPDDMAALEYFLKEHPGSADGDPRSNLAL